jgi:hypothetical protein
MTEEQVMNRYGQIKMDIIYGRLPPKQVRLFVLSMIRNLNDPNIAAAARAAQRARI